MGVVRFRCSPAMVSIALNREYDETSTIGLPTTSRTEGVALVTRGGGEVGVGGKEKRTKARGKERPEAGVGDLQSPRPLLSTLPIQFCTQPFLACCL
jgi:hypothetical protein